MKSWELISLELDDPARDVGEYFEGELGMPIRRVKRKPKESYARYHDKGKICRLVERVLGKSDGRKLVLYGYGGFHHYTYGLCKHADRFSDDYAYVHFDHHSDTWREPGNELHCAGFVQGILEDTNASSLLYIGSLETSDKFFPEGVTYKNKLNMTERDLRLKGGFEKLESELASLPQDVYLSFDLDVMAESLIRTPFNQGDLTLGELMKCVEMIKQSKHIIGADVLGYSGNNDAGKDIYAKVVASLMQQGELK